MRNTQLKPKIEKKALAMIRKYYKHGYNINPNISITTLNINVLNTLSQMISPLNSMRWILYH